jgi:hypothetical protein
MTTHERRQAICNIVEKYQAQEATDSQEEIIQAYGGWERYIDRKVTDALRQDCAALNRAIDKIRRREPRGIQLMLPGLEDLPYVTLGTVRVGNKLIPPLKATKAQQKKQHKRDSRIHDLEAQILTGRGKLFAYLDEAGIPDDWTGQQIKDRYEVKK